MSMTLLDLKLYMLWGRPLSTGVLGVAVLGCGGVRFRRLLGGDAGSSGLAWGARWRSPGDRADPDLRARRLEGEGCMEQLKDGDWRW